MILTQTELNIIGVFLQDATFGLNKNETEQVLNVLTLGNKKHSGGKISFVDHLRKSVSHSKTQGFDNETGFSHRAHSIARILLGLITACRNERLSHE